MAGFGSRLKHAWNAFAGVENSPFAPPSSDIGAGYTSRPDRVRVRMSNERSIISSIYVRLGIDVSGFAIRHVRNDETGQYLEDIQSNFNNCLTVAPNIDQTARSFRQDAAMSLFEDGVIAIVAVDTTLNPSQTGGYDINSMRIGRVVQWFPQHVTINLYNEQKGVRQDVTLEKRNVAIIENPFYSVMNEPNSTLQRLIRKLNILDAIDDQSGSGKLDLIIQLPYVIKSEARRLQAEQRRTDIEFQLKGSKYGIAYTDGTEKVTQLNRPAENNMLAQVEFLTTMLYSQLGLTEAIMNGTADEAVMLSYYNRTIEPILDAIVESMKRAFLTSTARTQNQSVSYFRDPFKLVTVAAMADIADKFSRNEILTSNELRAGIGFRPSTDPRANQLVNSNMPAPPGQDTSSNQEGDSQNGS